MLSRAAAADMEQNRPGSVFGCSWAISSCVQERVRVEYGPAYRRARLSRRKASPLLRVFRGREGGVDGSAYLVKLHRRALRLAITLQDGFHHSPSARSERHEGSGSLRTLRLVETTGSLRAVKQNNEWLQHPVLLSGTQGHILQEFASQTGHIPESLQHSPPRSFANSSPLAAWSTSGSFASQNLHLSFSMYCSRLSCRKRLCFAVFQAVSKHLETSIFQQSKQAYIYRVNYNKISGESQPNCDLFFGNLSPFFDIFLTFPPHKNVQSPLFRFRSFSPSVRYPTFPFFVVSSTRG